MSSNRAAAALLLLSPSSRKLPWASRKFWTNPAEVQLPLSRVVEVPLAPCLLLLSLLLLLLLSTSKESESWCGEEQRVEMYSVMIPLLLLVRCPDRE